MFSKDITRCITAAILSMLYWTVFCTAEPSNQQSPKLGRADLIQAVQKAKNENQRQELLMIIGRFDFHRDTLGSQELLSDYISFLKDDDHQVRLLGAKGLYELKNPSSLVVVYDFVASKDFNVMVKQVGKSSYMDNTFVPGDIWDTKATEFAILTLGEIGNDSVIPLLESIRKTTKHCGSMHVEQALAKLGAIEILSNLPPDADTTKILMASYAINRITDPNEVPELRAVVYNQKCAVSIRNSALAALGKINTIDVPEFLLGVINNSQFSTPIRGEAVIAAGQTGNKMFEQIFLEIVDSDSDIRVEGLYGLAILKPDKYLSSIFKKVRDESESDEFRSTILKRIRYITTRRMLKDQRDELYSCLKTNKKDGSPHDEVRVQAWSLINKYCDEEPSIVLSSESSPHISIIKRTIQNSLNPNRYPSSVEFENAVKEKSKRIVTILPGNSGAKK